MTRTRALRPWIAVSILGIIGTVQYHLTLFTSRFDIFFGDRGDARGVVYICEHWYRALTGKAHLMSPAIFYPTKGTLAYSELLMGLAIPYSLLRASGVGMFTSMEIVLIGVTVLNYVACFVLLHVTLRLGLVASCAGAMFFAFSSPKFFQLIHLQLQFVLFLPLILICLITFARQYETISQRRAAVLLCLAVLLLILQTFTTFYYTWYLVLWCLPFLAFSLGFRHSRRFICAVARKNSRALLAAGAMMALGAIVFLLIFVPAIRAGTWYRYDFVSQMIPSWWSMLSMGDGNYLWGWLTRAVTPNPPPSTWGELRNGFGLVPSVGWLILTVWSIRLIARLKMARVNHHADARDTVRDAAPAFLAAMILATTVFYLIGFRYWHNHSPWLFIYRFFPGGAAIRAVSRYVIFLSLPMAIGLAYAVDAGLKRARKHHNPRFRKVLSFGIVLLAAFGIFEQFGIPKTSGAGFSIRAENAYLNTMAAKLSRDCTAFYVAPGANGKHGPAEYQYDGMLISAISGVPTLNASMSQFPPGWELYFVSGPAYEESVKEWIDSQHISGKVCRLEIGPQAEAFDIHAPSPIDDPEFFVRQHYRDFAGREPTPQELQPHIQNLQNCELSYSCDRADISLDIFRGTGFAGDGSFIYRLYQVAFGRAPRYEEFAADLVAFREGGKNQLKFVDSFANRDEFVNRYSALSTADYVNRLADNSGASNAPRQVLISSQKGRAQVLLELSGNPDVSRIFTNRAFVTLHYFGYLRRDPDRNGFGEWLQLLERTGDFARMTSGFVNSIEYRQRFFQ